MDKIEKSKENMNEMERLKATQETIAKTINESGIPLTTIYMMLQDFQRQIVEVMANPTPPKEAPKEG